MFIVQWKGKKIPELVESTVMNDKFEDKVIEFYESITVWDKQFSA